ncbi:MAG: PAS domain-containing protein [Acidimicrobiales bacterium]
MEGEDRWAPPTPDSAEARALDLLGVGFLLGDGERLLHANEAAARLFGRPVDELIGRGEVRSLLHPDDERRIAATVEESRDRGVAPPDRVTARIVRPDGSELPVELRVRAEVRDGEVRTSTLVAEVGSRGRSTRA